LRICDIDRTPANAIPVEKDFYLEAVDMLKKHSSKILSENLGRKHEGLVKTDERKVKVRFLKPMPAIVGSDLNNYGPFKEDDVFELPETNAVLLIKQRLAEEFVESTPQIQEE
jgi:DNA replication initiation complex subunit (GINS family)